MQLYNHQSLLVKSNPDKHLLAWEGGTGKTATAITLANNNLKKCLVICPKSVVINWQREVDKFSNSNTEFTIIQKETFRRDWNKIEFHNGIIFDEFHYFSGMTSQMYKNAMKYIKKHGCKYIWGLTGTPYLSTPFNIYCLSNLLGRAIPYIKFRQFFFHDVYMGNRIVPVIRKNMEGHIADIVNKIGSTVKLDDCIDIPPEVDKYEYFSPNECQLKACSELIDTLPIVRYSKIHQILNGTLKSDGYIENRFYENEKLNRVLEIISENKKCAVVCSHLLELQQIKNLIPKDRKVFVIEGATKERQAVIDEIESTDDCVVLISIGVSEGYNIPSIKLMVLYSLSYNYKDFLQIRWRIRRIDHPQKCVYINMIYKDTVDEYVFDNISKKNDVNLAIYDKKV